MAKEFTSIELNQQRNVLLGKYANTKDSRTGNFAKKCDNRTEEAYKVNGLTDYKKL
jgi:hypothetical protein